MDKIMSPSSNSPEQSHERLRLLHRRVSSTQSRPTRPWATLVRVLATVSALCGTPRKLREPAPRP